MPLQQAPTAADVEGALERVFERPEFAVRELPGILARLAELYRDVRGAINELFARLLRVDPTEPVLLTILIGWLIITAAALLLHLAWTSSALWRGRDRSGSAAASEPDAATGSAPSAADWETRARDAAAAGRLREAALALYQAVVLRLEERGAVRYDGAKTPGDYRAEARSSGEAGRVLDRFLRGFEPVAFGGRAADAERYRELCAAAAEAGANV